MNLKPRSPQVPIGWISAAWMLCSLACADSSAMGRHEPTQPAPEPAPVVTSIPPAHQQGYTVGQRNGSLIVERLKARTIESQGCQALGDLEQALLKVTRTVRPPAQNAGDRGFSQGFFRGYLDAVRDGLHEARLLCSQASFVDGELPGSLYGTLVCQVGIVDIGLLSDLELPNLYNGWSGGSQEVQSECSSAASIILSDCQTDLGEAIDQVQILIGSVCSDTI